MSLSCFLEVSLLSHWSVTQCLSGQNEVFLIKGTLHVRVTDRGRKKSQDGASKLELERLLRHPVLPDSSVELSRRAGKVGLQLLLAEQSE